MNKFILASALVLGLSACQQKPAEPAAVPAATPAAPSPEQILADFWSKQAQVQAGDHRSESNRARDKFRNPRETLQFFGLGPGMNVIEITPGGGWYTEVLAPLMKGEGSLTAVIVDPNTLSSERSKEYFTKSNQGFRDKLAAAPELYGEVQIVEIATKTPVLGEPGSADMVLTFRNVHNWTNAGDDAAMFMGFAEVLKPGGVLGVEEHRADADADAAAALKNGYLSEAYVIKLASDAGLQLASRSEINANPRDTKDHPNGVWNLPPNLNTKEGDDKAKYEAIGESDRMTLRFIKPATAVATPANTQAPTGS